ncbi:hypothetical protein F5Y14DRAFT_382373 [Nemania sp. NC0429]|nr:hypothetical protein F5Y14DRAFT_382373 [Nemania sp. NC0429]
MHPTPRLSYGLGPPQASAPKERRSAMKRTTSQLNTRVQIGEDTIGSVPELVSPRSRAAERPSVRFGGRTELHKPVPSVKIIESSSLNPQPANDAETPLEEGICSVISVTNSSPIQDTDQFVGENSGAAYQTSTHASERISLPLGGRAAGERSSARSCSRNVEANEVLKNIMDTLRVHKIPGPQLFRWETEFQKHLGEGGEGSVRGTQESVNKRISGLKLGKTERPKWDKFAIKRHRVPKGMEAMVRHKSSPKGAEAIKSCFEAAEAEIKALSHLLRGQRNIVQLRGWGLCLDTLEQTQNLPGLPTDTLFSNLQLPLLVLERGDGDLEQFLKHVFGSDDETKARGGSLESVAEEGRVGTPLPEPVSFSGSTLNEDENVILYNQKTEPQEISNDSPKFWIINGMNQHEVLRRLCIDIGHGLRALHNINMTHGDLKPQNVLVFREGPVWIAKLCDFGHSNSFDASKNDAVYLGTPSWRPHWFGDDQERRDIATLQDFDLTVYGLLVWSAFCPSLRGRPPRISAKYPHAKPHELFQNDLREMIPKGCGQRILGGKAALVRRVNRLVRGTVCASYDRYGESKDGVCRLVERPWEKLYNNTVRATRALWTSTLATTKQSLKLQADGERSATRGDTETISRNVTGTRSRRHDKASIISARDIDYNIPPLEIIADTDDTMRLHGNLLDLIRKNPRDLGDHALLYSQARLRANRVDLATWRSCSERINIVEEALKCRPPLNIYTMAWLCKGPVGTKEVRSLPAHYLTWEPILDRGFLNESKRLELFLLLMQFGAPIEQTLDGHPEKKPGRSILMTYLRSCRLAIRAVVSDVICRRYEKIPAAAASDDTRYYMTAAVECRPSGTNNDVKTSTALGNIRMDRREHKAAYPFLKLNFEQLLDEQIDISDGADSRRPSHASTNEETPLQADRHRDLPRYLGGEDQGANPADVDMEDASNPPEPPLPGWSEYGGAFINELTGSITLTRPKLGLAQMRGINIGHPGSQNLLEIDLADFLLPPNPSSSSSLEREEDPRILRQRVRRRFPPFDEAWFSSRGWGDIPPDSRDDDDDDEDEDVLGAIRDHSMWEREPARATSSAFEIRPPDFSAEVFLSRNFSTLLFFIQYPATTLGLLWELVVLLHRKAGDPILVAYEALRGEVRSLNVTRRPLLGLLRWAAMVLARAAVLLLAGLVCLLCAALVVAVVLALTLG